MTVAEVIDEVARRLVAIAPSGSEILLFGSHARGEGDARSDLDVLVIEPRVEDEVGEAVRLRRALNGLGLPIDVVVLQADVAVRRARVPGTMVDRARREGRVLATT